MPGHRGAENKILARLHRQNSSNFNVSRLLIPKHTVSHLNHLGYIIFSIAGKEKDEEERSSRARLGQRTYPVQCYCVLFPDDSLLHRCALENTDPSQSD